MNDLVSVVVPVYNMEKYLERCLSSLAAQDYPNYEVILVNDGSVDKSQEICEKYCSEFENFYLINQKNGGLSEARNAGIKESRGQFITFVDSDDYVTKDCLRYFMDMIEKFHCEVAICAHQNINPGTREMDTNVGEEELISDKEYFRRLGLNILPYGVGVSAHSKIFHRSLFNDIKFPPGKLFEDTLTTYKLLIKAKKVALGSKIKYFYVRNENSIVQSSFKPSRLTFIDAEKEMAREILNEYPDLSVPMKQRVNYAMMNTLAHAVRSGESKYLSIEKQLRKEILQNFHFIIKSKTAPRRDKIGMYTLKMGLIPYKFLFNIYKYKQSKGNN